MALDYSSYLSPFSWRYGSQGMRRLWGETHKRRLWREIWVALAQVQSEYGLFTSEKVQDLRAHVDEIDIPNALEVEAAIGHDLMAELKTFASQCPVGGGSLHLGATSTDIEDNAEALRVRQSLDWIIGSLSRLLEKLALQIEQWSDLTVMAYTHLQPAEPTTLGYRFALYAQDLLMDWESLRRTRAHVRGKGFKGAVGTGASYAELIGSEALAGFETRLSTLLGLPFFPIAAQTYPRKQDYQVIGSLAALGGSLYKLAFDLRFLQSPQIGELAEPFGRQQVGSSAMPFKRNPIQAEKIDSLARYLAQLPRLAWDNAAHSLLERTLDDSANRRSLLPEAFLAADELLITAERIIDGLQVNQAAISRNLAAYAPFAATERVLMALVKAGADRQAMHSRLRELSLSAWQAVESSQANPLAALLSRDPELLGYLTAEQITGLMDARHYVGDAPQRARRLAQDIREALARAESA
jgi:adenylosuccinate lyase